MIKLVKVIKKYIRSKIKSVCPYNTSTLILSDYFIGVGCRADRQCRAELMLPNAIQEIAIEEKTVLRAYTDIQVTETDAKYVGCGQKCITTVRK